MNECVVRSAVFMDFMAVLNIVNAPENQVYSNKQETIELLDHMDWFKKKYFSGERNYCYVIEMEVRTVGSGVVVGFCRYDYADDRYVGSIRMFERAGFKLDRETDDRVFYVFNRKKERKNE